MDLLKSCGIDFVGEELAIVVPDETNIERKFEQPERRLLRAVEMHFFGGPWKVVGIAVRFESGSPADCDGERQGLAALRDFDPVYVLSGSKREALRCGRMSASPAADM